MPATLGEAAGVVAAIGNTPIVELRRLSPREVRVYAKLEGANPSGSVKDRVAWAMLEAALADGSLRPGQTILEPSSGNTGISLAMLAARLGHPVRVVMPDNTTAERIELLRLFGAEIVFSPGAEGSNGAVRRATEMAEADRSLFMPYQYGNPANPRVHEETTGPEIVRDVPELDVFVAGLGTGGTLTGVARFLRGVRRAARVVAAEPLPGERVQGLRSLQDGFVPPVLDESLLDDRYVVSARDAVVALRRLLREEGLFVGLSSGAAVSVALRVAAEMRRGSIVVLLADGGWKYLSARLWTRDLDELTDELEASLLW